jgi:rubrerythrin
MVMNTEQLEELILQALEHELGGVAVYETAITCAINPDLEREWTKYLAETRTHVQALEQVCSSLSIDPARETPGRGVVRSLGVALVDAMKQAIAAGDRRAAQLVACDAVVLAETRDHANWQLLSKCAEHLPAPGAAVLEEACRTIEDQEDEHFYHTKGWCRELWIEALGLPAVLPPPEEKRHVKTAIGAARAEQAAEQLRMESRTADE